jgi:hypothetical protein
VYADLYLEVVARSDGHCACDQDRPGWCGRKHPVYGSACNMPARPASPLVAAPIDPFLPPHRASALDAEGLMALCRDCFTRRASAARKAAHEAAVARAVEAQAALF